MIFVRTIPIALAVSLITLMVLAADQHTVQPPSGFVPDEVTAVRVAEAILIPIYGQTTVEGERPFTAKLTGNVWKVTGYLPPGVDGGVAEAWIDRRDGRILRVTHGK